MSIRAIYGYGLVLICFLLGFAVYLEKYAGVIPCPLCMMQRYILIALGLVFAIGVSRAWQKVSQIIVATLAIIVSLAGIVVAGRQTWLQHFPPPGLSECSPSFEYMIQSMPLSDVFLKAFEGGEECARQAWVFLHLSLAEWSLLCFAFFIVVSIRQFLYSRRR